MHLPTKELKSDTPPVFGGFDTKLNTYGQVGDIISKDGKIIEAANLIHSNPEVACRISEEAYRIVMETQPFLI